MRIGAGSVALIIMRYRDMSEVGYTVQGLHAGSTAPIVSLTLGEEEARLIIQKLWPKEKLWGAPSGCSFCIETQAEVDEINLVLKGRSIVFDPEKHSWHFHVYLV